MNFNPKVFTAHLRSLQLQAEQKLSFRNLLLKTDCRWCHEVFGVNSTLRPRWIKNPNSVAQNSADTLRHPLCAVTHFSQHKWSSRRWCHLNRGPPFRSCFVALVHNRTDWPHHSDSNKWTGWGWAESVLWICWGDWRAFDIHQSPPPSRICLLVPWKRPVWLSPMDCETWNPLGTTDESSRTDSNWGEYFWPIHLWS